MHQTSRDVGDRLPCKEGPPAGPYTAINVSSSHPLSPVLEDLF